MRRLTLALVLCTFSCVPYYSRRWLENPDHAGLTKFHGIAESLRTQKVVRMLVVHGMGNHGHEPHPERYAHGLLGELQRQLALKPVSNCKPVDTLTTDFGASS